VTEAATVMHIPLPNSQSLPHDQMLFILSLNSEDSLYEVAEFFGLAGLACASVTCTLVKANAHKVFHSKELARLLAMDQSSLKSYCNKKKISLADKRRLLKWSRWSKSAGRNLLERLFKEKFTKQTIGFDVHR